MNHFPFDRLVDVLDGLGSPASLAEDRFLILDIDLLRDLRMSERRKMLKRARSELQRRTIQERIDEIAEAFDNEDHSLVEVLSNAFPSDLLNFGVLTEPQKKRWLAKAELAAVGLSDQFVTGDPYIYFIGGDDGRVKIGYTIDLRARLSSLQTGSSRKLMVLLTFPGEREREIELHRQFDSDRLHGEWFAVSPAIKDFMDSCKSDMESPKIATELFG
ncbi:MAG: GIY-YIG nuclease family protein [Parvibaculum sp.]|nr:GIY-YIG nuclease family protein [Parvibaculum sp.]